MNNFFKIICISLLFFYIKVNSQTVTALQMQNARATGYAIVAARNPGKSFSVYIVKWDGVHDLEYNANNQINSGWHPQAAIKGNYFDQAFVNNDFTLYSSVVVSQAQFDNYKAAGSDWWIVCSTLPSFSNTGLSISDNGNVGIGTANPNGKFEISGGSGVYSDFASYSGTTINNILPNGKEPTLIISEKLTGVLPSIGNEITYKGGLSFGRGGPGIYSINPNPAGSGFYGELRFHTTYWNGSNYNNADRMVIKLDGNVGIGTTNPTSKLTVAGNINSREVKVTVDAGADFVFEKAYNLPSLSSIDTYIKENKHLPEIASAKEMQANGINLSEMNIKLLQKVEELTLYIIEMQKENQMQNAKIKILESKLKN